MTDAPDAATPAPRRASWRRRLLKLSIVLVALWLLAPLAISIPAVRSMIADDIGAKIDRKVEIGGASAYWFRGIDLEDITVHSPEGFDGPLAVVPKIHADLDILGALAGSIKAKVRVVQPHLTLRRNAAGHSNSDGVLEALQEDKDEDDDDSSSDKDGPDVELVVIGGKVESLGEQGAAVAALHDLDVGLSLRPSGDLSMDIKTIAAGAATGGGGARIAASAEMRPDGSMPFRVDVPGLDLARIERLVQDAAGIETLAGTLEIKADGERSAGGTLAGTINVKTTGLAVATSGGTRVTLKRLLAHATMRDTQQATEVDTRIQIGDLRVDDTRTAALPYREPSITFAAKALVHPKGWIRVSEATADAGDTVKVVMPQGFKLQVDPELRFDGEMAVTADLGRLGALRGLIPALEPLGAGRLSAKVRGTGDKGLEMGIGAAITGLALRPSEAFPQGYNDPQVRTTIAFSRSASEGVTVRLYSVASQLLSLTTRDAKKGVALGVDAEDRFWLEGGFDASVDLAAASRLLAADLPLEPGERITGRLALGGVGRGGAESMQLQADVHMQKVVFPPSWGHMQSPADLRAALAVRNDRANTHVEVTKLAGMGLSGELTIRLRRGEAGTALQDAEGQIGVDFAGARPWLGGMLGLDPAAALGGMVRSRVHFAGDGAGHRLDATAQISDLLYRAGPGAAVMREARITVRANAWLAPEGGRSKADDLKLTAQALTLDASGSSYVSSPDENIDLSVQLSGDAEKLAPTVASLLGEGYEDLTGRGRISGTVSANGSTAEHMKELRVDGNVLLGSWKTSGLDIGDLKATLARASSEEPLSVGVVSKLNRGRVFGQGALTLGSPEMPWRGTVDVTEVDTSGVLTSKGIGRMLAFALPALLPSKASTAVLSGLLTARVEAQAPSVEDPAMLDGLTGEGRISMAQGEIKNSTLFGGGGGGSGLAQVIQGLKVAVPEAGRVLEGATKALTFSSLESQFRVANRIVQVERAKLSGNSLDVDMQGTVNFDQRVALQSKLILLGSAGKKVEKALPGGAIPLRIGGTLGTPQVRPDVDLGKLLAGAVGDPADLLDQLKKKKLPKIKNPFR